MKRPPYARQPIKLTCSMRGDELVLEKAAEDKIMRIRIDGTSVEHHASILLRDGEVASLPVPFDGWDLTVRLDVINADGGGSSQNASVDIIAEDKNVARITLKNWDSPIGTSLNAPHLLGVSNNNKVRYYFIIAHWRVGHLNKIDIQFQSSASDL